MKKHAPNFLLTFFVILVNVSCIGIPGRTSLSGEIVTDQRDVPHFDAIIVTSGIDLILNQGATQKVIVKADQDLQNDVKTEVEDGELKISCARTFFHVSNITVEVTITDLKHLKGSAGSDIKSTGILNLGDLTVEISSGSDLTLEIEAKFLDMSASSGSEARLKGKADDFSIKASSGSDVYSNDFEAENVTVTTSSGSDVRVNAHESIKVNASGGSDVYITGNPEKRNVSTSGGSDVYFR